MHGSCLPLISIFSFSIFSKLIEFWHFEIDGVGLTAIFETIGIPLLMPPIIPPELLVLVSILPSLISNSSFICDAVWFTTSNPRPISTPFTAPIFIKILARSPSSLSNTGSPNPSGTLIAIVSTIPPTESPCCFLAKINSSILFAAFKSPQRTGFFSMFSFMVLKSCFLALMSPICVTWEIISIFFVFNNFLAIAPPITWPIVTLPLPRPPPL